MRVKELCKFIEERELVLRRRMLGLPQDKWTRDHILATYRFCNVHREDDRVTKWIATHWRGDGHPDLWFAMVIARLFNQPSTLQAIGFPHPWKPEHVRAKLHRMQNEGLRIFNAAYIVSTNGRTMNKIDYLFQFVLGPLWAHRYDLRPRWNETLAEYHKALIGMNGLGSFMAAQVIADLKYTGALRAAPDWLTWAAPGPGSMRGLNRVEGRPVTARWPDQTWLSTLQQLQALVNANLREVTWRPNQTAATGGRACKLFPQPLHAQDLQNCLCEFDKYERARLGEGRPKQRFTPQEN